MSKKKQTRTEQKVRGKISKAATKSGSANKKLVKKHQDYLRGLEKRKQELIIANRATHNKHAKELGELEKTILEWKARIASESGKQDSV